MLCSITEYYTCVVWYNPPQPTSQRRQRGSQSGEDGRGYKTNLPTIEKKIGTFFPLNFYYWVYAPYSDQVGGSGGTLTMFMPQTGTLETQSS